MSPTVLTRGFRARLHCRRLGRGRGACPVSTDSGVGEGLARRCSRVVVTRRTGRRKLDPYELTRTIAPTHLADSAIAPLFFPTITAADHASQQHSPGSQRQAPADTRMPGSRLMGVPDRSCTMRTPSPTPGVRRRRGRWDRETNDDHLGLTVCRAFRRVGPVDRRAPQVGQMPDAVTCGIQPSRT